METLEQLLNLATTCNEQVRNDIRFIKKKEIHRTAISKQQEQHSSITNPWIKHGFRVKALQPNTSSTFQLLEALS